MASIAKRPDGRWRARYRDDAGREHSRHFTRLSLHHVELDSVDEGVIVDRPGVSSPVPERLTIRLARGGHVIDGHGREGQDLEGVDLDDDVGGPVVAANRDFRSTP